MSCESYVMHNCCLLELILQPVIYLDGSCAIPMVGWLSPIERASQSKKLRTLCCNELSAQPKTHE